MSHVLRVLYKVRPHRSTAPSTTFPGTYTGLITFLSHKYGIKQADVRLIVRDIFTFIRGEVLLNGVEFAIPRFGVFRRSTYAPTRNTALFGEPVVYSYLRFRAPRRGSNRRDDRSTIDDPDDELIEDGDPA